MPSAAELVIRLRRRNLSPERICPVRFDVSSYPWGAYLRRFFRRKTLAIYPTNGHCARVARPDGFSPIVIACPGGERLHNPPSSDRDPAGFLPHVHRRPVPGGSPSYRILVSRRYPDDAGSGVGARYVGGRIVTDRVGGVKENNSRGANDPSRTRDRRAGGCR